MRVNNHEFSEVEIRNIFNSCFSKQEVAKKLGFPFYNGKITKKLLK